MLKTVPTHTDASTPRVYIVGNVFIFDPGDAEAASRAMREPIRLFRSPSPALARQRPRVCSKHRPRNRTRRRHAPTRGSPDDPDPDGHPDARRERDEPAAASAVLANTLDLRMRAIDRYTGELRTIVREAVPQPEAETVGLATGSVLAAVFGPIRVSGVER